MYLFISAVCEQMYETKITKHFGIKFIREYWDQNMLGLETKLFLISSEPKILKERQFYNRDQINSVVMRSFDNTSQWIPQASFPHSFPHILEYLIDSQCLCLRNGGSPIKGEGKLKLLHNFSFQKLWKSTG